MKVGDLVRCKTYNQTGIIVGSYPGRDSDDKSGRKVWIIEWVGEIRWVSYGDDLEVLSCK